MIDDYLELEHKVVYAGLRPNSPPENVWNDYDTHEYVATDTPGGILNGCSLLGERHITKVSLSEALIALGNAKKFQARHAEAIKNLETLVLTRLKA